MIKEIIILSSLLTVLVSCSQTTKKETNDTLNTSMTTETREAIIQKEIFNQDLKTIKLDFDFIVYLGQEEDFQKFKTYTFFKLTRNNTTIFIDSSLTEYEFGNKLFPIIIKTGNNSFELLFEINDRPNKNYLKRLFIKDNKLVRQDKLPTFEGKPIDINQDGIKEYAGFWDYSQVWGDDNNLTAYNPILYYSVTTKGLLLDSLLTRERNEMIYGKFYGFAFSENDEQPIGVAEKFGRELKLINGGQ
ncbi:hypothetical protein [Mariniradius sediminis]|uniref:Uncharacterized protein n=1 Tax=Mariniradius sediminis TaxID=2909237 RepID=A0ABS9C0D6_9BACT|nr:hypothetical protein [Mariniradius sediminis]MCF1753391.1 hypothetical protein [Mariniradius sediminis]